MKRNAWVRLIVAAILVGVGVPAPYAQDSSGWPVISPEDLALEDNPLKPGSNAMILFKRVTRDDLKGTLETHYRIKIFTESGRSYGDIEIPYIPGAAEINGISARTIQPDGRVLEFTGAIYEKTLARQGKQRLMAKTFTMPSVTPGAIIDYRYALKTNEGSGPWVIQEELFIREATVELRSAGMASIVPRSLPGNDPMLDDGKGFLRATLRNIPAFEEEVLMPPESSLKARYYVVYPEVYGPFGSPLALAQKNLNTFFGKPGDLSSVIREIISTQDSPEVKVSKLYKAVQERVRNLSYEEAFTKRERKIENIKERRSAQDVWRFGYGTDVEIVLLFAALCRAAGFTADPVGVISRDTGFYEPAESRFDQLRDWIVGVNIAGRIQMLDPGVRFAPYGWVSWQKQFVRGVRFGAQQLQDVETGLQKPEENRIHREITLLIQPDGSGQVAVATIYTGEEAIDRRNNFFDLSKEQRERELRNELKALFPSARIQQIGWEGMDDSGPQAKIGYRFDLPSVAQLLGSRMILDPTLFDQARSFPNWKRIHPIYFRRSIDESQDVRVILPQGYQLEDLPQPRRQELTTKNGLIGTYQSVTSQDQGMVVLQSRLTTVASLVAPEDYPGVKRFYDQVAAAEDVKIVSRRPARE